MIKRKVVEVIEEYNDAGKLIRKTTTETTEDDDVKVQWVPYTNPNYTPNDYSPYWGIYPPSCPNQPSVTYHVGDPYPCCDSGSTTGCSSAQ